MTRPELPITRRMVSTFLSDRLGGTSEARAYYDESGSTAVAVIEASGTPDPELSTYATDSVHASPNLIGGQDVRVELCLVGRIGLPQVGKVLASAAFYVVKERLPAAPGVVFPGILAEHFPATSVPHLLWVAPVDFAGLGSFDVEGLGAPVNLLQGVPISDEEFKLLTHRGFDELERALEAAAVVHFDLDRASAV